MTTLILSAFLYEIWWKLVEAFDFYSFEFFNLFYRDIKFWNFDVSMKLPLQRNQTQKIYFLKERT